MASLLNRITRFFRGPQGRRLTEQAKQLAKDPRTREQARTMLRRFRSKR